MDLTSVCLASSLGCTVVKIQMVKMVEVEIVKMVSDEITKVVKVTEVVDDLLVMRVNKVMDDTKKVEDTRVVPS